MKVSQRDGKFFIEKEVKPSSVKARLTNLTKKLRNAERQVRLWTDTRDEYNEEYVALKGLLESLETQGKADE